MAASSSRQTLHGLRRSLTACSDGVTARPVCANGLLRAARGDARSGSDLGRRCQRRLYSSAPPPPPPSRPELSPTAKRKSLKKEDIRYNFNTSLSFTEEPDPDHVLYRTVTAADVASRREPPTRVKMLVRDFIHDSLYNPNYGYFSKNATIFSPPEGGYDFTSFKNQTEFTEEIAARYVQEYGNVLEGSLGRQVWHTPTELFKPFYAQALVSAMLQSYHANQDPSQDLIIYEMGAGNGSFMIDAMAFLRDNHPEVFAKTRYKIIEISTQLATGQRERAEQAGLSEHVEVIESDFFTWEGGGDEPCFVIALEVLDNLSHDMVRYDLRTLEPLQALVVIDQYGDFQLLYEPVSDPLLKRALSYRDQLPPSAKTRPTMPLPLALSPLLRNLAANLPFAPNLSKPDFIPSKAISLLERLHTQLPQHRLLIADFSTLPDTVPGRNGPVVQTRVGRTMVPCETFLVKQGYFDIFFPTDFELLRDLYSVIMRSAPADGSATQANKRGLHIGSSSYQADKSVRRDVGIYQQADFVRQFGGEEIHRKLTTKDGSNLVDAMYSNAKILF